MTAFVVGLVAPASAQKAEIEAVNAKWIEFFNKGDFAGVASLYTTDATAFPQGSAGRSRHWGNVQKHGGKSWRSETDDLGRQVTWSSCCRFIPIA